MSRFLFYLGANNHLIAEKSKEEEKHENMKKVIGWQFILHNVNLESYFLSQLIEEHMVRKFTHSSNLCFCMSLK